MNVLSPSQNAITGRFTSSHKGYDHDDVPTKKYYASFNGIVKHITNDYTTSWIANTPSDPWYVQGKTRALRTEDFGNFIKILGDNGITQLAAHFPKNGIMVKVGDRVVAGQVIAIPPDSGNDTGNSTGGHTHTEYRNAQGVNIEVTFEKVEEPMAETITVEKKDWDRLYKASQLGDRLLNKIGVGGNIADKSEADIDLTAASILTDRQAKASCENTKPTELKRAKEEGYAQGLKDGLAQSGSNIAGAQPPEGFTIEKIAVEVTDSTGKRTTTYIPKP